MYNRFLVQLCRPKFNVLNRIQIRGIKVPEKNQFITSVTEEYEKMSKESENQTKKDRDERRKRAIRYLVYNPTPIQKLIILKARFFATGWVYVASAVLTVIAVKITKELGKWAHKDRYAITNLGE